VYPEKITSRKIAMLINGKDRYEKIRRKDFVELYTQLGLNPLLVTKNLSHRFSKTMETAKSLRIKLNSQRMTASPIYDDIIALIEKRLPAFV
jgi:hypothetical protein